MCLRRCACAVLDVAVVRALRDRCSYAITLMSRSCCCAVLTVACSIEGSSRCFVSADSRFAPCLPVRAGACRWCPALSLGRWWPGCWRGCRGHTVAGVLAPPWGAPLPCGLPRGWGCFLVGIKITPRPSSWKVDGVGVHFMLTNSIHPGVTVALPAAPTTSALDLAGRGSACLACRWGGACRVLSIGGSCRW